MLDTTYSNPMDFLLLGLRLKNSEEEITLRNNVLVTSTNNTLFKVIEAQTSPKLDDGLVVNNDSVENVVNNDSVENDADDVNDCDEYEIYTKIEVHMSISASLYILNRQGNDILYEIGNKKIQRTDNKIVEKIYTELGHCINTNRIFSDLYTNLISHLDDVLFEECGDLDTFYVKEDEYTLESLYYKQGSWVNELEWNEPQVFEFNNSADIDEGECMYLLMFLNRYLSLLYKIEKELVSMKSHMCIEKMRGKMMFVHDILTSMIDSSLLRENLV